MDTQRKEIVELKAWRRDDGLKERLDSYEKANIYLLQKLENVEHGANEKVHLESFISKSREEYLKMVRDKDSEITYLEKQLEAVKQGRHGVKDEWQRLIS